MIYNVTNPDLKDRRLSVEKRLENLHDYLVKQNRQLTFILKNIGEENLSGELKEKLTKGGME